MDRYLKDRNGWWYYQRRVPARVAHLDERGLIQTSLDTQSVDVARLRRDAMSKADDALWQELKRTGEVPARTIKERYDAACARAMALGFVYRGLDELANAPLEDLVARLEKLQARGAAHADSGAADTEALLGGVAVPKVVISQAMEDHIAEVGPLENQGKSAKQIKSWEKVKRRAAANFCRVVSDKAIDEVTRADGVALHDWWRDRVVGVAGGRQVSPNTANRDMGNMRKMYDAHFKRLGDEDRPNPFRNLSFSDPKEETRAPFSEAWIRDKFLVASSWGGLNADAALLFLCLVETGCRPSEVANIRPENIYLDHAVPHILIKPVEGRAIKTRSSRRTIPLVGVSLAAFAARPGGFPRYHDKEDSLSATLMKHFRRRGLLPSGDHSIYSIRHAFEDRMLQGDVDTDLRARLMGHKVQRPDYGEGGSLEFRAGELGRIALPFPQSLVAAITG